MPGSCMQLSACLTQSVVQVLSRLLASSEYLLCYSQGRLAAQRLIPAPFTAPVTPKASISSGTAIVTGGSKGLGLACAQHQAASGLQALVIAARSPELSKAELIKLAEHGTAVWTVRYAFLSATLLAPAHVNAELSRKPCPQKCCCHCWPIVISPAG